MAAVQILAYGFCFDSIDDAIKIGESTTRVAMLKFCEAIINTLKEQYLCDPTTDDIARLLAENKERRFQGMIGSLDCMHWRWDACHVAWRGQYNGPYGYPTLILEAAASQDLWIWYAFFGMPGTNNDITVLDYSPLFNRYMDGTATPIEYEVNGRRYNLPYYLTDGIYPKHAVFMQAISNPVTTKERAFTTLQEAFHKDIERMNVVTIFPFGHHQLKRIKIFPSMSNQLKMFVSYIAFGWVEFVILKLM
ncbi:uncharacterized protein LOC127242876 [Andrographis paniculata]|uniref:uncharacterized protein LOC127242876 n=1 Tax=Andrographis paniculata TaxID=175694 RepID=UPI0021E73D24|nr:uncharacterized protein LOC127242876 [Andrographis paniculata]